MNLSRTQIAAFCLVKAYLECNAGHGLTIEQLMRTSGLSETSLRLGFKFCFQITIYEYHRDISMEYAKALLEDGMMVKLVARKLGYRNATNFTRAFQYVFSKPPGLISLKKKRSEK
ncbi:AraC family transcriptional regulator [Chitinophaga sp. MM2321]|uniref:AraC family transcriptional regulator n=1 Tax=Chitinophaga sp. MM2321 TaxID=3137178 RepID=UPI0032D5A8E5